LKNCFTSDLSEIKLTVSRLQTTKEGKSERCGGGGGVVVCVLSFKDEEK